MPWMKSHAVLAKNANHSVNIVISLLNPAGFKIRRIKIREILNLWELTLNQMLNIF